MVGADAVRFGATKERLLANLRGRSLMVAVGTGQDIQHLPAGLWLVAVDISGGMLARARRSAGTYQGSLHLLQADVGVLPFADGSFETIVTSCTFCSVPDPISGLRELRRLLRPDGRLLLFEHVRSHIPPIALIQDLMTPLTRRIGPEMNRDTLRNVVLGEEFPFELLQMLGGEDRLNMTLLAMNLSQYVNGVAKKHGEVSRTMFPGYPIDAVTNGVHSTTWTWESFRRLFDRHIPGWSADPFLLRNAIRIPTGEIWGAHVEAKRRLFERVNKAAGARLDPDALTLGYARRATQYKRMTLVLRDPDVLRPLVQRVGPLQFVFAGKAHPRDDSGRHLIREVFARSRELRGVVEIAYLPDYDTELAALLTAGADIWLNTPSPPLEASGISGMKAAHNGVPSLSVVDGWWLEGHLERITGWSIGCRERGNESDEERDRADAADLYRELGEKIAPLFYGDRDGWVEVMRHSIAINASFFNTHRMVQQYAAHAYLSGLA
jgi:alpha-glucan phosphorylase-like protein